MLFKYRHKDTHWPLHLQDSSSPVRTTRDPSPVKQLLTWNAPIQEYKCPRSQYGPRPETAESVRKSYELQIQQRDALHEAYAQAESKWPYQPIHHPEARYAYFTGPRYDFEDHCYRVQHLYGRRHRSSAAQINATETQLFSWA